MKNLKFSEFMKLLCQGTNGFSALKMYFLEITDEELIHYLANGEKGAKELFLVAVDPGRLDSEEQVLLVEYFAQGKIEKKLLDHYIKKGCWFTNDAIDKLVDCVINDVEGAKELLIAYCKKSERYVGKKCSDKLIGAYADGRVDLFEVVLAWVGGMEVSDNSVKILMEAAIHNNVKGMNEVLKSLRGRNCRAGDVVLVQYFAQGNERAKELLEQRLDDPKSFSDKAQVELVKCIGNPNLDQSFIKKVLKVIFQHSSVEEEALIMLINYFLQGVNGSENIIRLYLSTGNWLKDKAVEKLTKYIEQSTDDCLVKKCIEFLSQHLDNGGYLPKEAQLSLVRCLIEGKDIPLTLLKHIFCEEAMMMMIEALKKDK